MAFNQDSLSGISLSKINPNYLHANSTSHVWAFGAIAELIDNAYDPDVKASHISIDKIDINKIPCLVFVDNGAGMNREQLLKMLSLGCCDKEKYDSPKHKPIGKYGNGFKSGSMRLGKDVIIFTRRIEKACVGLLSQTYLKAIDADSVIVPILEYSTSAKMPRSKDITENNLQPILKYSPFKSENELKNQIDNMKDSITGTKIIIYNLSRLEDGTEELDFQSDPEDILCPESYMKNDTNADFRPVEHVPEYKKSLRAFCSILYLCPKMKISVRKVLVKSKYVSKMLKKTAQFMYKPQWLKHNKKSIKIVLGLSCERDWNNNYGFFLYYKNRMIKAYEKIGCQKQIHPKYLFSNSTSHTWAFSAVAELIDNAYDPDVGASHINIDKIVINEETCLLFVDNGSGMNKEQLKKMLSFGYCDKDKNKDYYMPIGRYGNGFKSGSMRLGNDAIVFTKSRGSGSACVGLLSQTFLKTLEADLVYLPMLEYLTLEKMSRSCDFGDNNLDVILRYSPFKTEKELKNQFDNMKDSRTGTMIIIYNLSRLKDGTEELDFNSDPEDILCPESYMKEDTDEYFNPLENVPRYKKSLKNKNEKSITIVLGMVCEDCEGDFKDNCGFFLYNRNRLIKAFEKIGCQKQANEKGVGVIGVAELDILTPTHNKQDFCPDRRYNTVMNVLSMKLLEYWSGQHDDDVGEAIKRYKKPWVQCHQCFQWRSLPSGIYPKSLPDEWFCHMNNGSYYNRCEIEEEPDIEMANKKREKRNLRSLNKKKYSESLELEAFNERDSEETSPPTKQPIRKVAKRNLKSSKAKLNCLKQFPCVPTSSNVKQPLPGCSRDPDSSDSDETVLHGSPSKELHKRNLFKALATDIYHSSYETLLFQA
ncbi:MORC family CW-type zinc finger protein 3-like isoform X2 [Biomphalaria glabrata]|uniref:MORC family CW-type zinc finger protein 3-like isoform X2 n=1 Tax=Biomphalaria glabrata TaxID=6526 RepID=A0A9W3AMF2_BIOGL|nr:MORC family CW-type zinc finger protein 3-like isoform X2 [Biomphalaria glabrata]